MVDRARLGATARRYGHDFERRLVRELRSRFDGQEWTEHLRRSDQGHGASLPDVCGWPGIWPECQTAANPNPAKKMAQAVRDVAAHSSRLDCLPVVVWRKKKSTVVNVTIRALDLAQIIGGSTTSTALATMAEADFFDLYEAHEVDRLGFDTPGVER